MKLGVDSSIFSSVRARASLLLESGIEVSSTFAELSGGDDVGKLTSGVSLSSVLVERSSREDPGVAKVALSSPEDDDSMEAFPFLASSAAISSLSLFASCIASSMAPSAMLTVRLCSAVAWEGSAGSKLFADAPFSVWAGFSALPFALAPSTPASMASRSPVSLSSSRYTIQSLINSGLEQLVTVIPRTTPARISRKNIRTGSHA